MNRLAPVAWAAIGGGVVAAGLYLTGVMPTSTPELEKPSTVATPAVEGITLDGAAAARSGVRTATLTAGSTHVETRGFARALDVGPLAAIDAEVQANVAAAAASQAEVERLTILYRADQSASLRAVEAARAQAIADRAKASASRHRVAFEYGPGLSQLGSGGIRSLVADVATAGAALVRIDIQGAALALGSTVRLEDGNARAIVRTIGSAAAADSKLQTAGALAIVRGPFARQLLSGRVVPAIVAQGPATNGVLVPRGAIVRWQGTRWAYRRAANGSFERVELTDGQPAETGWLVTGGDLHAGDVIAVEGAGALLGIERGGGAGEDE
ncbi:MAG: hypothetical protein ABI898_03195 [Sphingomonadales bacterium]